MNIAFTDASQACLVAFQCQAKHLFAAPDVSDVPSIGEAASEDPGDLGAIGIRHCETAPCQWAGQPRSSL